MADLSKLRFNGTDYNVKDASAPLRKFTSYSKTGNLPITSDDTTQTAIGKLEKALDSKIDTSAKGTASGVAELDANGKVPSSQLPSYVDDVLEYSAKSSFPSTGETGKIYVDTSTNKTYRWSGSAYVEISESLALGETSSTAYRGDRGKAAYDHSQASGNPHGTTGAGVNLTGYSKGSSTAAVAATDTVNAAIAKHENRIDANKTNILYAIDTGVKNLCPINNGSLSEAGYLNEDGADGQVLINPIPSGSYKLVWTLSSTATECGFQLILAQGEASVSANRIQTETKHVSNTTGTFTADITIPSGKTVTNLVVYANKAGSVSNVMICRADLYSQDSTYVPYALPNYDLTRLQSEDRASLAGKVSQSDVTEYVDSQIPTTMGASGSTHKGGLVPDTPSTAGTSKFLREDGIWVEPSGGGGSVNSVSVNGTKYSPDSSGDVSLPNYPTTLPASDVYSWAKAVNKPSYTASDVGLGNVGNFKAVSTVASQGLSSTEKSNARANIGAGTSNLTIGTSSTTAAVGNHTHTAKGISLSSYSTPSADSSTTIGTSDTIQTAVGKLDRQIVNLNDMISSFTVNNSKSVSIKLRRASSFSMLMFGFVQTIGKVHWYIESNTSTSVSVIDAMTGSAVSQSVVSFDYSESTAILTISANVSGNCNFVLIRSAY